MSAKSWSNPPVLLTAGTLFGGVVTWGIGATAIAIFSGAEPSDWLGFAGSALGCLFTLIAVGVAYAAIHEQKKQATIPHLVSEMKLNDERIIELQRAMNQFRFLSSIIDIDGGVRGRRAMMMFGLEIDHEATAKNIDTSEIINAKYKRIRGATQAKIRDVMDRIVAYDFYQNPPSSLNRIEFDVVRTDYETNMVLAIYLTKDAIKADIDATIRRSDAIEVFLKENIDSQLRL